MKEVTTCTFLPSTAVAGGNNLRGLLFSLAMASVLGLVIGGSQAGGFAVGVLVDLCAIASVLLWPICARRCEWGYRAATVVGSAMLLLATLVTVLDPARISEAAAWAIIQIPTILFARRLS